MDNRKTLAILHQIIGMANSLQSTPNLIILRLAYA